MKKFALRFSRAPGSTQRLVEKAIAAGWRPGLRVRDALNRKHRHVPQGKGRV